MAIVGRDLDVSERKVSFQWNNSFPGISLFAGASTIPPLTGSINGIQTGSTLLMFMMPFPCQLQSGSVYSNGLSGAPQISLNVDRFIGGAGVTTFAVGISNMVLTTFGTSGVQGLSGLPLLGSGATAGSGNTTLNFYPGDLLFVTTSVANTFIGSLMIELVVRKVQDIVAYNGVQT